MPPLPARPREDADVESSSNQYAQRFAGAVGRWFLDVQARLTLAALAGLPVDATVLDVGGGHAQVAPVLIDAGYRVTIAGSALSCSARLRPWLEAGQCHYETADLHALPHAGRQFDAVICYRLLAHSIDWQRLLGELCRVARHRVIIDYPSRRSVNQLADTLFEVKRRVEGGSTRPFLLFAPADVRRELSEHGFRQTAYHGQFLLPMAVHRSLRLPAASRAIELPGRALGLTRWFGSPVILRADRVR